MSELWESVASDLETILRTATSLERSPTPDGLPPAGTWVRAVYLDDDARPEPVTPWHFFGGWNGQHGNVTTRCRRLHVGSDLEAAIGNYIGDPSPWRSPRTRLQVELDRPAAGACRKCTAGLERDATRAREAEHQARHDARVALLPVLEAIATDPAIDDAERGRRMREAWTPPAGRRAS